MKLEWKLPGKLTSLLQRYRYPLLILLAGLVLLLWPGGSKNRSPETAVEPPAETSSPADAAMAYREQLERELESLLSQVQGAGRVRVLLTLKTGPAAQYQTDRSSSSQRSEQGTEERKEEKTVLTERGSAYNEPTLVTTAYPVFQGALIVSQGAGDPSVRLALLGAVSALLGLGADQVTVVTMK